MTDLQKAKKSDHIRHLELNLKGTGWAPDFCEEVQKQAEQGGVDGFVRSNGRRGFQIVAEGNCNSLSQLIMWIDAGEHTRWVNHVEAEQREVELLSGFQVR